MQEKSTIGGIEKVPGEETSSMMIVTLKKIADMAMTGEGEIEKKEKKVFRRAIK